MSASLRVMVNQQYVGILQLHAGEYIFSYDESAGSNGFVSLTMPVRGKDYVAPRLHPIFEMHLPEGYLLSVIKKQFAKLVNTNDFGILELLAPSIRGRITYSNQVTMVDHGLQLSTLLHANNEGLFDELVARFALRSALSGVQPKVLAELENKATLQFDDYIVKAWGSDYPELALNEYCCMLACQYAGIPVPEFYISDDKSLFVMKRFDLTDSGLSLGFEDMCVLQAKQQDEKYFGSYEGVAKTIKTFASPKNKIASLEQFYKMIVINNLLQNGDGHLKNFGMIYESVSTAKLAPAYDVVCTTAYIRNDISALTLMDSKKWWTRKYLQRFAIQACELTPARATALYDDCLRALGRVQKYIDDELNKGLDSPKQTLLRYLSELIEKQLQDSNEAK